jgi:hypothetical protein
MGGPGHSAVDKLQPSQLQLLIRPVLVAAANTRMNRFVGWGGLAWAGSLVVDIMLLSSWTADLEYCAPHMRGSLDLMLQHGNNVTTASSPIVKADVDAVAKVLSANYSAHAWQFTDVQLNTAVMVLNVQKNGKVDLKNLKPMYDTVTAALKKKGFRKDIHGMWSGTTELTIASARSGLRIMQTSRNYMQDIIWPIPFSIPIDSCGKTTTSPRKLPAVHVDPDTTTTTPPTVASFANDMHRYVKQVGGNSKRRLSSAPSPSNAPATPSPWSSSGTSAPSPSNAPATPSPWSSGGTSAQSPSNAPATRIDRSCCTAASNDGDYDCRCRDGSCWYAGDVQSGIVFPSLNWNKEGKTCKTKEATTTTTVAPTTTTTTTVAPTTSGKSNSEAAAINKTGSSSESSPGICVNEEFSIPPGYLKVRKRGLCVRLHTGSGAFSFNGEL